MKEINKNNDLNTKEITIMDPTKEGMPSLLCSGCWPMEELEAYLKQSKEKKESEMPLGEEHVKTERSPT